MANHLTATVEVRRRGFLGTLVRVPRVFRGHYKTMRRAGNDRILSAYGAWLLTGVVLRVK